MSNYQTMARRQRIWMSLIIALVVILTLTTQNKQFFQGLLLGCGVSYYNLWLLQQRTNLIGEVATKGGKRRGTGTILRLAIVALGALLAIRFELSILGFIIGLMITYPVIVIDFL